MQPAGQITCEAENLVTRCCAALSVGGQMKGDGTTEKRWLSDSLAGHLRT